MLDLPQVAQFLSTKQSPATVPWLVLGHLCREIVQRYGHRMPPALANAPLDGLGRDELALRYEELLETIWRQRLDTEPHEPHRLLASLPFRLYITTNPEQLLVKALAETRAPHSEICRWNAELADLPSIFDPPAASSADARPRAPSPAGWTYRDGHHECSATCNGSARSTRCR